jgi:hypothetical protein
MSYNTPKPTEYTEISRHELGYPFSVETNPVEMAKPSYGTKDNEIIGIPKNSMSVRGVVIKEDLIDLYIQAAGLANTTTGDAFYQVEKAPEQTYEGEPIGEDRVCILLTGKYVDEPGVDAGPFWDALQVLKDAQQKQAGDS